MAKQGTSSVFKKLFLLFLGLVAVVYVVLVGFFVTYVHQQREIETGGQIIRVTNSASVIEQQIMAISNVELELVNDTRIMRLSQGIYEDNYERSQLILEVLSTIQNTQSINNVISDIVIYFPKEGIELSAVNGYHKHTFVSQYTSGEGNGNALRLINNRLTMHISYPLMESLDDNYVPDYEIYISLSDRYLNGFLDNFRNEKLEGAFWVLSGDDERKLLFSTSEYEVSLMEHWDEEWSKSGRPAFYAEEHICNDGEFLYISQYIEKYDLFLVTYQNTLALAWELGETLTYMGLIVVGMGLLFGMMVVWANRSVNKPIRNIMEAFEQVRSGELDVRIFHKNNDEFGFIYDSFNDTVSRIEELIENIKEQKALLQNAELMQLQSQINPHFLYNSFYNIKFMAHNEDYEQIETFVTALAKYYRFINKETHLDVDLANEVAHMENYIEIQQMRFGDKISVKKGVLPPQVRNIKVPKLILQPIIENAYNYGLKDTLEGGLLQISYRQDGNFLYIEIEDNGNALTPEKLEHMRRQIYSYEGDAINHALTNIQRRLMLSFGSDCGLTLSIGGSGGLRAVLCINTNVQM